MRRSISAPGLILITALVMCACSDETPEEVTYQRGQVPDEVITDFVTHESDSGMAQWRLSAPLAHRFIKEKLFLLYDPVIEFFDDEGNKQTTLVSESGRYMEDRRDMLAYGNVVVESMNGDVLETDSLMWLNGRDKIVSESFVKLTQGRNVITGIGLECDPAMNSVDIQRNVKARIIDESGELEN